MNICIMIPTLRRGGAERIASALANDFSRRGDTISVITFDNLTSSYKLDEKVKLITIYPGEKGGIFNVIKRISMLRKALKVIKPDVVFSFFMKTVIYALIASPRKTKVIGSERSNPYYTKKSVLMRIMEKTVLPFADGFVFITPEGKDYYSKLIRNKSIVIPNGVFAEDIPKTITPFRERRLNEISAVGRLHPVKDYITMIEAFNIFRNTHPDYKLKIYGEGAEFNKLKLKIKELSLENSVSLEGLVENVVEHIAGTGMYVLTSQSESWSNSLMEALACGIPCISTDCDFGPRSMIKNGENGLLVPVGDKHALANAMSRLANDRKLSELLSNNALLIRETHNATTIADRYYKYITR